MKFHCVLICIYMMTSHVEHFSYICLICKCLLWRNIYSGPLKKIIFFKVLLSSRNSLCIFDINILSYVVWKYFPHSVCFLFVNCFLWHVSLLQYHLFVIAYVAFVIQKKNHWQESWQRGYFLIFSSRSFMISFLSLIFLNPFLLPFYVWCMT